MRIENGKNIGEKFLSKDRIDKRKIFMAIKARFSDGLSLFNELPQNGKNYS